MYIRLEKLKCKICGLHSTSSVCNIITANHMVGTIEHLIQVMTSSL